VKFNHPKWDAIVQKKTQLGEELNRVNADYLFKRNNYAKIEQSFLHNYGYNSHDDRRKNTDDALKTDKQLSSVALRARIAVIKETWEAVCADYGFGANQDNIRPQLVTLLDGYLTVKNLTSRKRRFAPSASSLEGHLRPWKSSPRTLTR
jgi:hypothetical protein